MGIIVVVDEGQVSEKGDLGLRVPHAPSRVPMKQGLRFRSIWLLFYERVRSETFKSFKQKSGPQARFL